MDALSLRFTEAETSLAPPNLAAFTVVDRALTQLLQEQLADHDDGTALADLLAAGVVASRMQVLVDSEPGLADAPVFVTLRSTPIPAIEVEDRSGVDVGAFVLKDVVHGHLAWPVVAARMSTMSRVSRASLVMAVCIPLALPDTAMGQAPARAPATTQGAARAAVSPASATIQGSVRSTPAVSQAPVVPTPPASAPVVETQVVPPPPATVPPPQIQGPTVPTLNTLLQAMRGHEGVIFTGDTRITGLILSVEGEFVVMVNDERDGKIALIPKAQIVEVRGKVGRTRSGKPGALPDMPDGTGALAGGGIMTALGAPLMLSGLVFVGIIPSGTSVYLPQVIPAAVLLGGGIPLLVMGTRRRRAYNSAVMQSMASGRLTPSVSRTPHGSWTGGISLRF